MLTFLFLILCPLQATTARNETLTQHPDPTCFRGHALAMPAVIPKAGPPDKSELEAARLRGKQLSTYLFFSSQIMHRKWQDRAFWKMQSDPQQAGQNQSLDFTPHRARIINPTTVTKCCKFTVSFLHCEGAGCCLCPCTRQKEIIASSDCKDHSDHPGLPLI